MSRVLLLPFVLVIIAVMGIVGIQGALMSAGEIVEIEGEGWEPDPGNVTELEHSNLERAYYDDEVAVFDNNDNEMVRDIDYEWFVANGTVKAIEGGDLDGEPQATIDYSFSLTTQEQDEYATLLAQIPRAVGMSLPLFALFILLVFIRN